jgi:hypothetical protein
MARVLAATEKGFGNIVNGLGSALTLTERGISTGLTNAEKVAIAAVKLNPGGVAAALGQGVKNIGRGAVTIIKSTGKVVKTTAKDVLNTGKAGVNNVGSVFIRRKTGKRSKNGKKGRKTRRSRR